MLTTSCGMLPKLLGFPQYNEEGCESMTMRLSLCDLFVCMYTYCRTYFLYTQDLYTNYKVL